LAISSTARGDVDAELIRFVGSNRVKRSERERIRIGREADLFVAVGGVSSSSDVQIRVRITGNGIDAENAGSSRESSTSVGSRGIADGDRSRTVSESS